MLRLLPLHRGRRDRSAGTGTARKSSARGPSDMAKMASVVTVLAIMVDAVEPRARCGVRGDDLFLASR